MTGVCSRAKVDFVRSLGADEVLSYTDVNFTRLGRQWDWILDTDSHHSIFAVRRALRPGGRYVTLGGEAGPLFGALLGGPLIGLFTDKHLGLCIWWKPMHPPDVDRLKELIAAGQVRPFIDRRYPLDQIVEARPGQGRDHLRLTGLR